MHDFSLLGVDPYAYVGVSENFRRDGWKDEAELGWGEHAALLDSIRDVEWCGGLTIVLDCGQHAVM